MPMAMISSFSMPVIDTHAALLIIYQLRGMLHLPDHHAVGLALPEEYYDTKVPSSELLPHRSSRQYRYA